MRESFKTREIQPSKKAWKVLKKELKKNEGPTYSPWIRYAGVAAMILMLFGLVIYFRSNDSTKDLVMPPTNGPLNETIVISEPTTSDRIQKEGQSDAAQEDEIVLSKKQDVLASKPKVKEDESLMKPEMIESMVASSTNVETKTELLLKEELEKDETERLIDKKINEVIAQVNRLEVGDEALSDQEVEALLVQAQNEVLEDELFRPDHSIDANALLSQVESELNQSFRDQIFDRLRTGFNKARTALADRNN